MRSRDEKPEAVALRPIGARALKSAIDTLRPWLAGSRVLDLYSGQGRFGISALEEEASQVTFVELDTRTARALVAATVRYGKRAEVRREDALAFLAGAAKKGASYDLIFADPPFPFWNPAFSETLFQSVAPLCLPDSVFLVKHPARVLPSLPNCGFTVYKTSPFGESKLIYLKYGTASPKKETCEGS